jgi:hypothetical protein
MIFDDQQERNAQSSNRPRPKAAPLAPHAHFLTRMLDSTIVTSAP